MDKETALDQQILDDFFTFLSFPSISTDPKHGVDVINCAEWLQKYVKNMGFETHMWPTSGHPTLFASYVKDKSKPTLLIYNHYDVQPIDPLAEWTTHPFFPTIRDGEVYARGAQDNKGQCFYTLQALKALLKRDNTLPINIKLCIEGEEECGSAGLSGILNEKAKELKADYLAIVDLGLKGRDKPAVTLGVRGLVTLDVEINGTNTDLHSGSHGGLAYNPCHALVELLATLRDSSGKIQVPGFYDDVKELPEEEKSQINFNFDAQSYQKSFGTMATGGETSYSPLERAWTRPTIEINGICGGYTGPGFKTVIPYRASAKVSCRLVPDQEPLKIGTQVAEYLQKNAPDGTKVKVTIRPGGGTAVRANSSSTVVKAFARAYSEVFGSPCDYIFEGGSIPIVTELAKASGSEVVLLGLGLADDQIHAPNEHFGLDRLEKGMRIMMRAIELLNDDNKH